LKVTLFKYLGKTTYHYIDVEIDSAGNIIISGVVIGEDSLRSSSDLDSEYWITVPSQYRQEVLTALQEEYHKKSPSELPSLGGIDRAILGFMGRLYGGRLSGYLEFCKLIEIKGIPFKHENYPEIELPIVTDKE
jgi:hypothetical protein